MGDLDGIKLGVCGGSLGTSMGNFAKQEGRYLKSGAVLCCMEEQL